MIIPVRCFSCGNILGEAYEQFKERKKIHDESIKKGEKPKETLKEILDDIGVERYCCRRMILTHVDLIQESAPYE